MPILPTEIWTLIAQRLLDDRPQPDILHYEAELSPSPRMFCPWSPGQRTLACSLAATNSRFYDVVAPLLWRRLLITRRETLDHLAHLALRGPMHDPARRLGLSTRRVEVLITDQSYDHASLATLLGQTIYLKALVLDSHLPHVNPVQPFPPVRAFSASAMTAISSLNLLESLQFRNPYEIPTLCNLGEISRGCPSLNRIQVTAVTGQDTSPNPENQSLSFPNLSSMCLGGRIITSVTRRDLCALLRLLACHRPSLPRLRSLHLLHHLPDLEPFLGPFSDILMHGEFVYGFPATGRHVVSSPMQYRTLRSLTIKITNQPVHTLPPFPSIEELRIQQFPSTGYSHLYRAVEERCEHFLQLLDPQRHPLLETVFVFVPTHRYQPPLVAYPSLARQFRTNDVDLVVYPHPISSGVAHDHLIMAGT